MGNKLHGQLSDNELIALLQADDGYAYTEIYNRYKRLLYTHAYQRLRNEQEVDDIIHDLFAVLWAKRNSIEFKANLAGYLYTSVRNRILDYISHKQVESAYISSFQKFLDEPVSFADYLLRENQLKELVDKEIALLPEKMREIFQFSRKDGYSHREIAEMLGVSEKTVKNQVNNALKILRVKLGFFIWLFLIALR